jgi:catechol 2,3-dioxygenase-like lactoylglutathione lyase family enzyme
MRLALALCALLVLAQAACAQAWRIQGWQEAVVSVRNMDDYAEFFEDIAQWEVSEQGSVSEQQLAAWSANGLGKARYRRYANPGDTRGFITLVQFSNAPQLQIREDAQSWDTGGIFDLNVRVKDLESVARRVRKLGWHASAPITQFTFGQFVVKEWIVSSPDGLAFAMIQRISPALEGWPTMRSVSRSFNSTQVVADLPRSLTFYRDVLGFKVYLEHHGASEKSGANVLGLPHNLTQEITRHVYVLDPLGKNEGSVELLQFEGATGADFSARAVPGNLGIWLLRFPTEGVSQLGKHLQDSGHSSEVQLASYRTKANKQVQSLLVRAPEGALLEFFEYRP